jgi:hypothetical protein
MPLRTCTSRRSGTSKWRPCRHSCRNRRADSSLRHSSCMKPALRAQSREATASAGNDAWCPPNYDGEISVRDRAISVKQRGLFRTSTHLLPPTLGRVLTMPLARPSRGDGGHADARAERGCVPAAAGAAVAPAPERSVAPAGAGEVVADVHVHRIGDLEACTAVRGRRTHRGAGCRAHMEHAGAALRRRAGARLAIGARAPAIDLAETAVRVAAPTLDLAKRRN